MKEHKLKLYSIIAEAFIDIKYPGRSNLFDSSDIPRYAEKCEYELETLLAHDHEWDDKWQNVPKELVRHDYECLCIFSDVAYQFFLPVCLLAAIDSLETDTTDVLLMSVMYDLCHYNNLDEMLSRQENAIIDIGYLDRDSSHELCDWVQSKHAKLTTKQQEAICCFLEFVLMYSDDDEYIDLAQKTLDGEYYGIAPKDWTIS
jgi:hypothetical protein